MTRRAGLLAIAMVACGRSSPPSAPIALHVPPPAVDCRSVHAPAEPDLVGWDAGSREQLASLRNRGVVAVRYTTQGCNVELEVLSPSTQKRHSRSHGGSSGKSWKRTRRRSGRRGLDARGGDVGAPPRGLAKLEAHQGPGPAPPGKIALLTPQQWQLVASMQSSGIQSLPAKAAQLSSAVVDFWNAKKQQELDGLDTEIVTAYARAAMSVQTKNPAAIRAVRRLAHYTRRFGNAKMAKLLGRGYVPDRYLRACAALDRSESP